MKAILKRSSIQSWRTTSPWPRLGPEARELLSERWFLHELSALKVDGEPIYKAGTRLRARPATEDEWAIYDQECKTAEDADEVLFVYLVDLDSE
jgi:hypothetical protein